MEPLPPLPAPPSATDEDSRPAAPPATSAAVAVPGRGDLALVLVNHLEAMVAFWNREQTCVFANEAYSAWFGPKGANVEGMTLQELLGPLHAMNLPHIEGALRGERQSFERDIPLPGGAVRSSMATYIPYRLDGEVVGFFAHVADVTPLKVLERQLREAKSRAEELATLDFLTGLPNRSTLGDRLARAIGAARRRGEQGAVMMLDVNAFKAINDGLGHLAGDLALVAVAHRVRDLLRGTDSVARYGGDEFVVVAESVASAECARGIAARITENVARPLQLDGATIHPSVSIGIAMFPQDGESPDALLARADAALYEAKRQQRVCDAAPPRVSP